MLSEFIETIDEWILDGYFVDIRYIAIDIAGQLILSDASMKFTPRSLGIDMNFEICSEGLCLGIKQFCAANKKDCIELIKNAMDGTILINGRTMTLPGVDSLNYYSKMAHRDIWESQPHLQISRNQFPPLLPAELIKFDNCLRLSSPPFDGLKDAGGEMGLRTPGTFADPATINIYAGSPADISLAEYKLFNEKLNLKIVAHASFDVSKINLAIRGVPTVGLKHRVNLTDKIIWKDVEGDIRPGSYECELSGAHSALAMLMIGKSLVRRQWCIDESRTDNMRLVAIQTFETERLNTYNAIFNSPENQTAFEKGIACLMFACGFSTVSPLNNDAPDIILTTPGGKLILIECTLKIADYANKVGKLIDRKRLLSKRLQLMNLPSYVHGILVCASPGDQIAINSDQIQDHEIILLDREDLESIFNRTKSIVDPDRFIEDLQKRKSYGLEISQQNLPF